ncbi:class I fructose-bisphosphate aldolase [Halobacteria archaeon AArc-dxtr1]|nr:class I fructose-bisphosphate aldolase [Halobacteria archaeon AArc-dxtr1]
MIPIDDTPLVRDGRILILAMDHGLEHGPADFEAVPSKLDPATVFDVATHDAVTAIAVQKGVAEGYYPSYEDDVTLLAKVNGTSDLWSGEPDSAVTWSVDRAVDLGADAVGFTVYGGSNHEVELFEEFRDVQEAAREHDVPVVMWSYPRGQGVTNETNPRTISYATRIALELGADVAKVKYPGSTDAMAHAVRCGAAMKVVLSGGPKTTDREFLSTVEAAIDAGVAGLAVGRNVWQREDPMQLLDALEKIVYDGISADDALDT